MWLSIAAGLADGLFVALPTMATTNPMYARGVRVSTADNGPVVTNS